MATEQPGRPAAIERIDIVDYSGGAAGALVCSFFWSDAIGLTCSSPEHLAQLAQQGVYSPTEERRVFPRDGRIFFDTLQLQFSGGALRATEPRRVDKN